MAALDWLAYLIDEAAVLVLVFVHVGEVGLRQGGRAEEHELRRRS